ncbi:MAG: hypothetical protein U0694_03380 [Anaerolineae bacterium]
MRRFIPFSSPRTWFLLTLVCFGLLVGYAWAAPDQQSSLYERDLLDTRNDLEFLANQVLGEGVRSSNWTGNDDLASATVLVDLWFDNEILADQIFGTNTRPDGWIGATTRNAQLLLRNIRHDLELSADQYFGSPDRPAEWRGTAAIVLCSRSLQNIWFALGQFYNERPQSPESVLDYCRALSEEADNIIATTVVADDTELQGALPSLILAVRGDLERLADERLGLENRPSNWIGNRDINSPTLVSDIYFDLEALADALLGQDVRPQGWIGFVNNSLYISNRNLRHDLEALADQTQGVGARPNGWQGTDPLMRCSVLQQNVVLVAQQQYDVLLPAASADFCVQAEGVANQAIENPPVEDVVSAAAEAESRFVAQSQWAFAYLDVQALQYMGQMPAGVEFRAWYRNFNTSSMMFVSGEDFAVYIDRRWTTMTQEIFDQLPTLEGVRPLTFCDANWCNGPGPTPTPTGSGPLEQLIYAGTPAPTVPSAEDLRSELSQVSWNYIRVTYLLDNPTTNTAQVALEICQEPAQIACEPVIRVFNNNTGVEIPAVSQYNGLNVYEFPYGYTTNLVIEGDTLFSPDVWISDPTIR